jgi:phospholipase/carboxylesterase
VNKSTNINAIEFINTTADLKNKPTVFLFHGYGADAGDLVSLKDVLVNDPDAYNWIFPQGIVKVDIGGGYSGRAWWPLTMSSLPSDWSDINPPGIDDLIIKVKNFIESYQTPWSKIIIGGFSQGSMLATEMYLRATESPMGLLSFSGSLVRKTVWQTLMPSRKNQKVFLSHGEQDSVLPIKGTFALQALFKKNEIKTDLITFSGGHEIPMKAIEKAKIYMQNLRQN